MKKNPKVYIFLEGEFDEKANELFNRGQIMPLIEIDWPHPFFPKTGDILDMNDFDDFLIEPYKHKLIDFLESEDGAYLQNNYFSDYQEIEVVYSYDSICIHIKSRQI